MRGSSLGQASVEKHPLQVKIQLSNVLRWGLNVGNGFRHEQYP